MRPSIGFLLKFFAATALLFAAWSFGGLGEAYAEIVMQAASPLMRLTSGFQVSQVLPSDQGLNVMITRGRGDVPLPLRPHEMFSGLVPFLALIAASANLGWRRWLKSAAIGLAILFVFHIGLMLVAPYLTGIPQGGLTDPWKMRFNKAVDVFFAFYGLVGFAALPFLLWWVLTQRPGVSVELSRFETPVLINVEGALRASSERADKKPDQPG